jgi:Ca2+-binding RTX toxin-like protein
MNRARLDPEGEAARYEINLNKDLPSGTLTGTPKQVLAPNEELILAATSHSSWMLSVDTFSHTGFQGSDAGQRMAGAGYNFTGSWAWGENISWRGTTGTLDLTSAIVSHHAGLFNSAGHRQNILSDNFREVGISQEAGDFQGYNASMLTQNFARSGSAVFVTGVAYTDGDSDAFYTPGEGNSGISFSSGAAQATTPTAGGYSLAVTSSSATNVVVTWGSSQAEIVTDTSSGNAKLDLVNGIRLLSAQDLTVISGPVEVELIGIADAALTGNANANRLLGNSGDNMISGGAGNDVLAGRLGNDQLLGQDGNDLIYGSGGMDTMSGGNQNDRLFGGRGQDLINGDAGADLLKGGGLSDTLNGGTGNDTLFGGRDGDLLRGDSGADSLNGQGGNDTIEGGTGQDKINGAAGNDLIRGGDDNDSIIGGAGNDILYGDQGADTLLGYAGNDTLIGGEGDDHLNGGVGADEFHFSGQIGQDVLVGWEDGIDQLNFSGLAEIGNLADFQTRAVQSGSDVLLTLNDGGSLMIENAQFNSFDSGDFIF